MDNYNKIFRNISGPVLERNFNLLNSHQKYCHVATINVNVTKVIEQSNNYSLVDDCVTKIITVTTSGDFVTKIITVTTSGDFVTKIITVTTTS